MIDLAIYVILFSLLGISSHKMGGPWLTIFVLSAMAFIIVLWTQG